MYMGVIDLSFPNAVPSNFKKEQTADGLGNEGIFRLETGKQESKRAGYH